MSRNDLNKLHSINDSISCLYLGTFNSKAAIVSKLSIVFLFFHVKAYVAKIDIAVK